MQNPTTNRYTPSTSANAYSPSVPISVYRELADELQAARTTMDSLKVQNQQLVKQNQQLRQEVEKVIQSAQHLQYVIDSFKPGGGVEGTRSQYSKPPESRSTTSSSARTANNSPDFEFAPPSHNPEPPSSPYRETVVIEQESRSRRTPPSEGLSDVSGWMLIVAILLIVLTAFGTGFLIVRPLLNNSKR